MTFSPARRSIPRVYALRPAAPALRPFIEHYWFLAPGPGAPVDLRVDVFVDLRADLVFNHGAPYTRTVLGGGARRISRSNLDAQRRRPIRIVQRGDVRVCGVRFHLGGLSPFAVCALDAFTDRTPPPEEVLGPGALALDATLRDEPDPDARARALDAFFLDAMRTSAAHERFAHALSALAGADAGVSIAELSARAGVSPRQLHRLFARHLGVAPRTVASVLRFQRALRAMMRDPGCTLAALAVQHGYFDQAHFVREFKRFSGAVPRARRGYYPAAMPHDFAPNVVSFGDAGHGPLDEGAPRREPPHGRGGA